MLQYTSLFPLSSLLDISARFTYPEDVVQSYSRGPEPDANNHGQEQQRFHPEPGNEDAVILITVIRSHWSMGAAWDPWVDGFFLALPSH